jgi:hypothetical protein
MRKITIAPIVTIATKPEEGRDEGRDEDLIRCDILDMRDGEVYDRAARDARI